MGTRYLDTLEGILFGERLFGVSMSENHCNGAFNSMAVFFTLRPINNCRTKPISFEATAAETQKEAEFSMSLEDRIRKVKESGRHMEATATNHTCEGEFTNNG